MPEVVHKIGIALAMMGIGSGTLFPHQSNLILARAAPEIRGRAVGLMVSNQFLADTINPWVYPPLAGAVGGLPNAIVSVGVACAIGVVFELAAILGVPLFTADPNEMTNLKQSADLKLAVLPKTARRPRKEVKDDF